MIEKCRHGHDMTPENTSVWRDGRRRCKKCHRDRQARRRREESLAAGLKQYRLSTDRTDFSEDGWIIYFISDGIGNVKIGTCLERTLSLRLEQLQIGNATTLLVEATMPGGHATERRLHKTFEQLYVRGEWFRLEGDLVEFVDDLHIVPTEVVTGGTDGA